MAQGYTETSMIIRNGDPKLALERTSARGRRFTQPFTNNYALHSIHICVNHSLLRSIMGCHALGNATCGLLRKGGKKKIPYFVATSLQKIMSRRELLVQTDMEDENFG